MAKRPTPPTARQPRRRATSRAAQTRISSPTINCSAHAI